MTETLKGIAVAGHNDLIRTATDEALDSSKAIHRACFGLLVSNVAILIHSGATSAPCTAIVALAALLGLFATIHSLKMKHYFSQVFLQLAQQGLLDVGRVEMSNRNADRDDAIITNIDTQRAEIVKLLGERDAAMKYHSRMRFVLLICSLLSSAIGIVAIVSAKAASSETFVLLIVAAIVAAATWFIVRKAWGRPPQTSAGPSDTPPRQ